ncbi:HD domain-containing phosphohydrolase [uncultured Ilyobacter sp.]|uniref:HD-GYP domain-containing protein n=1 Tax=uncultured Ilyobacter sp. TaxID=544433 RepID=UPI0029C7FF1F|nr:HD domain-containing phosphohydrolase [uncultured Ilyobacter sp.]
MLDINSTLVILGLFFMLLGVLNYLKILKKLDFISKVMKTAVNRYTYLTIFGLLISFVFLYIFELGYIILARPENTVSLNMISLILLMGGLFVYTILFILEKTFFSIESFHLEMVSGLVGVVELRDSYTSGHSQHVADLVHVIFDNLPESWKSSISKSDLIQAALLHDIGKILVPSEILNKKTPLTPEEYDQIKKHVEYGSRILESFEVFDKILPWIKYHHERIDGTGYYRLKWDEIPLESKIIAVADTYSAVTTDRIYKERATHKEALEILRSISGTQLDGDIVEILVKVEKEKLEKLSIKSGFRTELEKEYRILVAKNYMEY